LDEQVREFEESKFRSLSVGHNDSHTLFSESFELQKDNDILRSEKKEIEMRLSSENQSLNCNNEVLKQQILDLVHSNEELRKQLEVAVQEKEEADGHVKSLNNSLCESYCSRDILEEQLRSNQYELELKEKELEKLRADHEKQKELHVMQEEEFKKEKERLQALLDDADQKRDSSDKGTGST
jgi:alkylhydroperoxidase family enzyme